MWTGCQGTCFLVLVCKSITTLSMNRILHLLTLPLIESFHRKIEKGEKLTFTRFKYKIGIFNLNFKKAFRKHFILLQFNSVAQLCPTLCDPMNCSTPGLPVHHQLPEFTETHVRCVRDTIQPSHPLSSPFPPAFSLSQHRGLFRLVSSSHQVAKVLKFQLQYQSFQ